jgi:multidrug efflux system membrane fusion protein
MKTLCPLLVLAAGAASTAAAPEVPVARPVLRQVVDYVDFTGRAAPVASVAIRARVTGYLLETPFKEGAEVKKGDVLAVIDPRPYQAELAKARAIVVAGEARLARAEAEYRRAKTLVASKAVGPEELDKVAAERQEAEAGVLVARAGLDAAKLNLDFTHVAAPVDGHIGRRLVDPGNLVKADETMLAKVVSEDPMYVVFDIDERTMLGISRSLGERGLKRVQGGALPVFMGLAGEEGYPHQGTINFINNEVNAATGTISVRAVFSNPRNLLLPGRFARIRLFLGEPYKAMLVAERAVVSDQGRKFVLVVNDKAVLEQRPVVLGALNGSLRVVKEGLKADDRVVVGKLKGLRAGMAVDPQEVAMPE